MKRTSEKIVFFGSGPVAAKSLEKLVDDFNIEAVITKPAKSRDSDPVPVLDLAQSLGLRAFLPSNKTELDDLFKSSPVEARLAVLVDYGIIVSQLVIDYFALGIVNSHFSLLPKWRGADPITFSILSGDEETGVSLMLINAKMDEGLLLAQASLKIDDGTTTPLLTDQLINLSNSLLADVLPKYINNEVIPYPQDANIKPSYSRKLTKLDGQINWQKPASQIEREIRAYIDWPKSYTKLDGIDIIVTRSHILEESGQPGSFNVSKNSLVFYCGQGALSIDELKPAGKPNMPVQAFLAGYRSLFS